MYYISHYVHCRGHDVLQEPRLGALHLPSSVLHILSCKSGASLSVLYLPAGVLHMPSCKSQASLRCTAFVIKCTTEAIMYIGMLTWVYYICNQEYCRGHHVHQEPHLGVLHLESRLLHMPSCTSGATLGYTTLTIMYFRSLTWVYCICHQKTCISYHVNQEPRFGVLHLPSNVLQRPTCTSGASRGCTASAIKCAAYAII